MNDIRNNIADWLREQCEQASSWRWRVYEEHPWDWRNRIASGSLESASLYMGELVGSPHMSDALNKLVMFSACAEERDPWAWGGEAVSGVFGRFGFGDEWGEDYEGLIMDVYWAILRDYADLYEMGLMAPAEKPGLARFLREQGMLDQEEAGASVKEAA